MASEQTESTESATMLSPLKIWGPPGVVATVIFVLSSTPGTHFPDHPDFLNNLVHSFEFGLLAFVLSRALNNGWSLQLSSLVLLSTAICIAFGMVDEAYQFLIPQRIFDLMDLFYDAIGAVAGSMLYVILTANKTKKTE